MGNAARAFDWASTPLGPRHAWPPELKTAAALVLESHFPMALVWGPEFTTIFNDAFLPILGGKSESLGCSFRDIWKGAWPLIGPMVKRALAGEATYLEDFEIEVARGDGDTVDKAWFTFCYSPVRLADGTVGGMIDTVVETTAIVRSRRESEVLRDELAHRLKNTMAMVQSLARRTLKALDDRDAVKTFEKRIVAMGQAHEVLARGGWQSASLGELADGLFAMHGDRFDVKGPEVSLGASATLRLSLILHELATNAAKYGALSSPTGRVQLEWRLEPGKHDGEELALCWREHGGPPVVPPVSTGFGTKLIDMGLIGGCKVERRYPPHGLEVDLRVSTAFLGDR
jgi:two-component sensor histidine kinase